MLQVAEYAKQRLTLLATCFHAGFLLGVFFDPKDGCGLFF
jgi:hypothetical protein